MTKTGQRKEVGKVQEKEQNNNLTREELEKTLQKFAYKKEIYFLLASIIF